MMPLQQLVNTGAGAEAHGSLFREGRSKMLYLSSVYGDRNKRKYGLVSNFIYNLKSAREWDKKLFFAQIFFVVPNVAASFLGTLLPARLVAGLEAHHSIGQILAELAVIALVMWLCNTVSNGMDRYCRFQGRQLSLYYMKKYFHKIMDVDYELLEDEEYRKVESNAWGTARYGQGVSEAVMAFPGFAAGFVGVIFYGILLAKKSALLLFTVMLTLGLSLWILSFVRKKHAQYYGKIQQYSKKEAYITAQSMDGAAGKDIRIYQMLDWFLKKYEESLDEIDRIFVIIHNWYLFRGISSAVLELLRDGLAFGLLVWFLVTGKISAADFVFYIGLVSGFSLYFEDMIRKMMRFNNMSTSISYMREFLETEDRWNRGEGLGAEKMEEIRKNPVKLELKHVSFTYPGNEKPTLSDINITIRPGEKLALIGLNGAGKTTLVKMICGFYQPTEGEILLNDIPVSRFNREEYYSLISVLFQDYTLLPLSLDENITGQEQQQIDRERLQKALEVSGFLEAYERLAKKGESMLIRELNEESVDFSGGEKQKMLFARALYKEAPLVILDEPTAALDPIAENELYLRYGAAMEGRTSIYISHRLSSTRFCDRILLLEHGRVIEEGTHESLLAGDTRYAQLFEIQSQYYREQDKKKQRSRAMDDVYQSDEERGVFDE